MVSFASAVSINASPERVWATLLQTDRWTGWDDALERVDGRLAEGGRLTIHVKGSNRPFKLRVTDWQPNRRIVLRGGMPLGLFAGIRTYQLTLEGAATAFTMEERYSGPLAGMITKSIPNLQPSFDAFAAGLGRAAEA